MNRSKIFPLIAVLSLAAAATQALAQQTERDGAPVAVSTMTRAEVRALPAPEATERDGAPMARSTLARSEVLADLEIWQRSGLAALERGEAADSFSPAYRDAMARYVAMRDSNAFAERVARIARERGETQLIAER